MHTPMQCFGLICSGIFAAISLSSAGRAQASEDTGTAVALGGDYARYRLMLAGAGENGEPLAVDLHARKGKPSTGWAHVGTNTGLISSHGLRREGDMLRGRLNVQVGPLQYHCDLTARAAGDRLTGEYTGRRGIAGAVDGLTGEATGRLSRVAAGGDLYDELHLNSMYTNLGHIRRPHVVATVRGGRVREGTFNFGRKPENRGKLEGGALKVKDGRLTGAIDATVLEGDAARGTYHFKLDVPVRSSFLQGTYETTRDGKDWGVHDVTGEVRGLGEPGDGGVLAIALDGGIAGEASMTLYLDRKGGRFTGGMARGGNSSMHEVDASRLRIAGEAITGDVSVTVLPEGDFPPGERSVKCEYTLNARVGADGKAAGTFSGRYGVQQPLQGRLDGSILTPQQLRDEFYRQGSTAQHGAAEFQWHVEVERPDGKTTVARLWIPPDAQRIRGVIIGGGPSQEAISTDPAIRRAAAAERLAIIAVEKNFDSIFNYKKGDAPEVFLRILQKAAEVSGYREIAIAPFFPFGHSVACIYASAVPAWKPERTFGAMVFKGGLVLPSYDPNADLSGIPILAVKEQYGEFGPGPSGVLRDHEDREVGWKGCREQFLKLRRQNPRMLLSMVLEAGTTHMAWSPRDGEYVGLFIRKAARARIPDWPVDAAEPVKCQTIDVSSGALTSTAIGNQRAPGPALYSDYPDSHQSRRYSTFWHVDLELARAWQAFHEGRLNKRAQFVTFADPASGKAYYSRHDLRFSIRPHYVGPDTFRVSGAFLDEYRPRDKYPAPEPPLGHADGGIQFRLFGGRGVEQVGPDTFRVARGGKGGASAAIVAFHPGTELYRYAEQPAGIKLPALTKGKEQKIAFPAIGDLTPEDPPVVLRATADSGLPVRYAVEYGPAVVADGTLRVTDIPPRAKLPMEIEVTAYQWGSAVEPHVQTADAVSQTISVVPAKQPD